MNFKPWRSKKERVNEEGQKTFSQIIIYCLTFLNDQEDIDSDLAKEQIASSNTKWVDYCVRKNLRKEHHDHFTKEINKILQEVRDSKQGNKVDRIMKIVRD